MRASAPPLKLHEPATYMIRVQGALEPSWSDRFYGLRIVVVRGERQALTELSGRIPDQAALVGVLMGLYDLGMPLLSVERLSIT